MYVVHVGLQPHARAASAGRTVGRAAAKSASRRRHTPDEGYRGLSEAVLVVGDCGCGAGRQIGVYRGLVVGNVPPLSREPSAVGYGPPAAAAC